MRISYRFKDERVMRNFAKSLNIGLQTPYKDFEAELKVLVDRITNADWFKVQLELEFNERKEVFIRRIHVLGHCYEFKVMFGNPTRVLIELRGVEKESGKNRTQA